MIFMARNLVAILAADIVGYSKLMGEDEENTLNSLRAFRNDIFNPIVVDHQGSTVKSMGDGWLVSFNNAKDAVHCAINIQKNLEANSTIYLRIGIHIGDIVHDDEEIYGDGINVAARLESLAEPGQVLISDSVHHSLDQKLSQLFGQSSTHQLKNIARPVQVFRWASTPPVKSSQDPIALDTQDMITPDKPSIAILPFVNRSSDADQEYFSDGLTEDIIIALSSLNWLAVTARNSSFSYKGQNADVKEIARELDVRYLVEGSARKAGHRIRVTAQLVNTSTGDHIWAERYDRDLSDIFDLQDELTEAITARLTTEINSSERLSARKRPYNNLDAWELYQRGMWYFYKFWDENAATKALQLLQRSVDRNPDFPYAYAALAEAGFYDVLFNRAENSEVTLASSLKHALKAVDLDPNDGHIHFVLGIINMILGSEDEAQSALERAIELSPNSADAQHGLGWSRLYAGNAESALAPLLKAVELSPKDPRIFGYYLQLSLAHFLLGHHEIALKHIKTAIRHGQEDPWGQLYLAIIYYELDQIQESKAALEKAKTLLPVLSINWIKQTLGEMNHSYSTRLLDQCRRMGLSE